ncbi:hypothetical protein [Pseudactinotalea terrae]|uniref:hypothetical protein n=1 Tax=Pseudactinotalea terrae TaxID=1743262 RepID=UPI0012E120BE|nr:hypothetical protein [Pseudactinotalea terrae]
MTTTTTTAQDATFALLVDGEAYYADTVTELVAALIPGYDTDHEITLEQRWRMAVLRTNALQADLAVRAVEADPHLMGRLTEEELTALFASRGDLFAVPATWTCDIPLVLIATDFAPYTDRPAPEGNVRFIDPADERGLLMSLTAAGDLTFYTREETP